MSFVAIPLIVAALGVVAAAQATIGASSIHGRVTSAVTGRPLAGATVRLQKIGNDRVGRTVRTDEFGRYELRDLPGGRYTFSASHIGYLEQNFDQPQPMARYRLLELAESEKLEGINFALHRGGANVGVITDEFGDPIAGVHVDVMRETHGPFGRRFIPDSQMRMPAITDDQGKFRVYSLLPGTYLVAAAPEPSASGGLPASHGKTYYPGTLSEGDAQLVHVALGQDAAVDFAMAPARMARVSGLVRDSQGRPASDARVILTTPRGAYFETLGSSRIAADGTFAFEHVRPGEHLLHVRRSNGEPRLLPTTGEWATERLSVNGADITDLVISTATGFVVTGRVIFEGTQRPDLKDLRLVTTGVDPSLQRMTYPSLRRGNGMVDTAGRFRIEGVSGKSRLILGSALPTGWFLKRVMLKGTDVSYSGIDVTSDIDGVEVVLTDRATTVTGTVNDARGLAVKQYVVTFFPVGQFEPADKARRLRTIRPDPDGIYRIVNLPPGHYATVAVPLLSLPNGGEWEPGFFERVRFRTTSLVLSEGQKVVFNLQLVE